jgi:hypothetical protein
MMRPPVADMPMNAMRNEATGKMTYFAPQGQQGFQDTPYPEGYRAPQSAQPEQKLGEAVEVMGKGKGRYAPDGRSVVFDDGSTYDLFPKRTAELAKQAFERAKAMQGLRKGEVDIAHTQEQMESSRATRAEKDRERQMVAGVYPEGMEVPQAVLEKRFGKPPKDMKWTNAGQAVPIPGSDTEHARAELGKSGAATMQQIDDMIGKRDANGALVGDSRAHPGFESAVGGSVYKFMGAGLIPGTDTSSFNARLDQVKGGAFLKAFESLKGAGAITEKEGEKATSAITRMNTAQSEKEFIAAATEFRGVVADATARLQGGGRAQPHAQPVAIPPPDKREVGRVYDTPKGKLRWVGNGWAQ